MRNKILKVISLHYGFDLKDVNAAFDKVSSFDKLIKLCENVKKLGGELSTVMKIINDFDKEVA